MVAKVHFLRTSQKTPNLQSIKAGAIGVGYNGSATDVENLVSQCNALFSGDGGYQEGLSMLDGLIRGAMIAFKEGRPDNLQALLAANKGCLYTDLIQISVLQMFGDSRSTTGTDLAVAIRRMDPDEAQKFLQEGLVESVYGGHKSFASALMNAGAKAGSLKEEFLRAAVRCKDKDMAVLLSAHGASFDRAIVSAREEGRDTEIGNLHAMKEQIDRDNRPPSLFRRVFGI